MTKIMKGKSSLIQPEGDMSKTRSPIPIWQNIRTSPILPIQDKNRSIYISANERLKPKLALSGELQTMRQLLHAITKRREL